MSKVEATYPDLDGIELVWWKERLRELIDFWHLWHTWLEVRYMHDGYYARIKTDWRAYQDIDKIKQLLDYCNKNELVLEYGRGSEIRIFKEAKPEVK